MTALELGEWEEFALRASYDTELGVLIAEGGNDETTDD